MNQGDGQKNLSACHPYLFGGFPPGGLMAGTPIAEPFAVYRDYPVAGNEDNLNQGEQLDEKSFLVKNSGRICSNYLYIGIFFF